MKSRRKHSFQFMTILYFVIVCCFLGGSKYPQQQIDVFRKLWYHTLVSDLCVLQSNLR